MLAILIPQLAAMGSMCMLFSLTSLLLWFRPVLVKMSWKP